MVHFTLQDILLRFLFQRKQRTTSRDLNFLLSWGNRCNQNADCYGAASWFGNGLEMRSTQVVYSSAGIGGELNSSS